MSSIVWQRILTKRALLTALGSLAGVRATGNVTATATGADTTIPPGTYGVPIIGGKATYARMLRVVPNGYGRNATGQWVPQAWPVTGAGSAVGVRAVCGGPSGNLPAGTVVLWQPYASDLEPRGVVAAGGISGGVAASGPGTCARVVPYEAIAKGETAKVFWEARGEGFPAVCVARTGSRVDELLNIHSALRSHQFRIFVVSARYDGDDERVEEAEMLLDAIEGRLQGLADVDGEVFSGPPAETAEEVREASAPNAHVFSLGVITHHALPREDVREGDGVSWEEWQTTQIQIAAPAEGALEAKTEVDITVEHE